MTRILILSAVLTFAGLTKAETVNTIVFTYKNEDLNKVIEDYAKASGQTMIVDPNVHGKITILNHSQISLPEAFNQLSSALAVNGIAISKQGDTMVVGSARGIQRNLIESGTELPSLRPDKMFMWTVNLRYVSADEVNKQLRIMASKDGELVPFTPRNQLVITDWVSNLYRIQKLLKEIDVEASPAHHQRHAATKETGSNSQ